MSYRLVNVKTETHKAIRELAVLLDLSMQETTKLAVMMLASTPEVRAAIEARNVKEQVKAPQVSDEQR